MLKNQFAHNSISILQVIVLLYFSKELWLLTHNFQKSSQ